MEYLVVGDLHGKVDIATLALQIAKERGIMTVFIGDYLDDFDRSVCDQIDTLDVVSHAVRMDQAIALIGNHERNYIEPRIRCSGYEIATDLKLDEDDFSGYNRREFVNEHYHDFIWLNGYLLTHAGVSQRLLDLYECSLDEYLSTGDFSQVGYSRGGSAPAGGLYWCDWKREFEPIDGVKQIVGHTRTDEGIISKGDNYCIDCLDTQVLFLLLKENGTVEILDMEKDYECRS